MISLDSSQFAEWQFFFFKMASTEITSILNDTKWYESDWLLWKIQIAHYDLDIFYSRYIRLYLFYAILIYPTKNEQTISEDCFFVARLFNMPVICIWIQHLKFRQVNRRLSARQSSLIKSSLNHCLIKNKTDNKPS